MALCIAAPERPARLPVSIGTTTDGSVEWSDNDARDLSRETRIDFPVGLRNLRPAKGMQHVTAFSPRKLSRLRLPSRESLTCGFSMAGAT